MSDTDQESETYSEAETVARREAALKRALAMPHKPHAKATKGRGKAAANPRTSLLKGENKQR
jgi:hypothetical protein